MPLAIKTNHLAKRYRANTAVKNLNLSVKKGEFFSLLGPNGAGKSTTLGVLTTVIKPSSGEAFVLNRSVTKEPQKVRSQVGVLFQNSMLDRDLTVYDNLDFQARLHGFTGNTKRRLIKEALSLAGLANRSQFRVRHLSGGMQRRLEIFRALLHHPKILFLDEPTTGLDPEVRKIIWDKLAQLKEKDHLTIVLTTHYLDEADYLSDEVAIIDQGSIKAIGRPNHLKRSLGGDIVHTILVGASRQLQQQLQRGLGNIFDFSQKNETVSFKIKHGEDRVPQIVKALEKNSAAIKSFQIKAPSLDDVFLSVTGHRLRYENST